MYAVEVIADSSGEWCGNGLKFPTIDQAQEHAVDLFHRWTLVRDWRVVERIARGWEPAVVKVEVARKSA